MIDAHHRRILMRLEFLKYFGQALSVHDLQMVFRTVADFPAALAELFEIAAGTLQARQLPRAPLGVFGRDE